MVKMIYNKKDKCYMASYKHYSVFGKTKEKAYKGLCVVLSLIVEELLK